MRQDAGGTVPARPGARPVPARRAPAPHPEEVRPPEQEEQADALGRGHQQVRRMAPHITVWIVARGINIGLNTRMYFDDEAEANAADPVLNLIEQAHRRDTLLARRTGERDGLPLYRFDILPALRQDGRPPGAVGPGWPGQGTRSTGFPCPVSFSCAMMCGAAKPWKTIEIRTIRVITAHSSRPISTEKGACPSP